jgi:glucosamine-6-phosphate deaminase
VTPGRPVLEVLPATAWVDRVADLLVDRLRDHPGLVVCLPTGSTPLPVYERVPGRLLERGVSAARATIVLLDEYLGLPPGHRARCDRTLERAVLARLEAPGPSFVGFDVDRSDPDAACARFDREVADRGGLDLVVLGLGRNGHVGMNEPGTAADAPTRVVELTPASREAAIGYGVDPPPTHGVTLGMADILAGREIWLLATGPEKADILAAALDGPVTPDIPASLLRGHPGLRVLADVPAASGLGHSTVDAVR